MKILRSFCGPAAVVALLLSISAAAPAKAEVGGEDAEAKPGITVTGIGLARLGPVADAGSEARKRATNVARSTAVARAIGDGRRRAKAIAGALGVDVGRTIGAELQRTGRPSSTKGCSVRGGQKRPRCLTMAAVTVTVEIVGGGDGSAEGEVSALGTASVEVEPGDPERNRSIKRAAVAARHAATVEAAAAGRRNARTLAEAAGLTLGAVVSVSEAAPVGILAFIDPSAYDTSFGTVGPGQFCGYVRRPIVRRDPETGRPHPVRWVRKRKCRVPREYEAFFEVRYETG